MNLADDTARNAAGAAVRAFFESIKGDLPTGTTIAVQPTVDELDIVTGDLIGTGNMTTTPASVVSIIASSPYAGGSGYVVTWLAGGVFNGRRIKGRTFIVPAMNVYQADGTLSPTVITNAQTAGNTLIATAGADFAIWNRQWTKAVPPVPVAGNLSSATACSVKDVASQLRSRRS